MKASLSNEPHLTGPKCKTTIKVTESLAAPLIAKTRRQFEQQLADKQSEFTKREAAHLTSVVHSSAELHGDLQGIAGQAGKSLNA